MKKKKLLKQIEDLKADKADLFKDINILIDNKDEVAVCSVKIKHSLLRSLNNAMFFGTTESEIGTGFFMNIKYK